MSYEEQAMTSGTDTTTGKSNIEVALISGGNRGIGLATAEILGRQGIHVVIGSRRVDQGEMAIAHLRDLGFSARAVALDVNDENSRQTALADVMAQEGRIDILINNAGVALDKWVPAQQLRLDVLRATMETNLYAPLRLCQLVLPIMQKQKRGRIVNLSSELGSIGESGMGGSAAYRISKTALNMLTKLLALELQNHPNILVNAAAPGWVKTELGGDDAPRTPEEGARTPAWLATLPDGGPNGGFFRDEAEYPW